MSDINNKDGMKAPITVQFMACSSNVFDHKKKVEILERFARLPMDEQALLEKIVLNAELEQAAKDLPNADDCKRVMEIIKTPKALKALKDNWPMLKGFIGL